MPREKQCRKCGSYVPLRIFIDGRERNLQNRKFCLQCSPFGGRNTKPDDPSTPCYKKRVNGKPVHYSLWSEKAKELNRAWQYRRRKERRGKVILLAGGCCIRCGYDKCIRALSFHHRDPATKRFPLNTRVLQSHSWDEILEEVKKCDLLCLNCHMELEDEAYESKYADFFDA